MIKIICVGKIKEKFYKDAINEYLKRLSKYTKVEIIEVDDDATEKSLNIEKERILKNIKQNEFNITLDIEGAMYDSMSLSSKLNQLQIEGKSDINFIIGGSNGLHQDIKSISNMSISFSKLTFPHQLFRVILLEQIYRCFKIINNESYHK